MTRRNARRLARREARGFTLIELMISLVMGLIVALAAVALAKTSTTTFHEQARMSGVEMTLRTASERLRNDLLKASFMSTPNIHLDPRIARIPGAGPGTTYRINELKDLGGVRIAVGAGKATTQGGATLADVNTLAPDDLFVSGNLTSDDAYRGQWVGPATCGTTRLRLNSRADPAVMRLVAGRTGADMVRPVNNVFRPGQNMTPAVPASYAVQLMDPRGCFQYLTVCNVVEDTNDIYSVFVDLAGGVLTPEDTRADTCGGRLMEEFAIAPVHRVRWYLSNRDEGAAGPDFRLNDPNLDGANKFNLYRQLLAADGATPVGPAEIVAEYAVDMKFGLVVHDVANGNVAPANIVHYDMDGSGSTEVAKWAVNPSSTQTGKAGPQRIRSVRYRLAFRAPLPDRTQALPVGNPYLARYCLNAGCTQAARVRTVMSEVALLNQARTVIEPGSNPPVPY